MITFDELQRRLAYGQLKNTSAVGDTNLGEICGEELPLVLSLTNQGLIDLATRFPLYKSQVDLTFVDGQNLYPLLQANIGTTLTDSVDEPFLDTRFVKVLDVFDELGDRYSVNTNGHIMMPSYNTLRFTTAKIDEISAIGEATGKVRIRYQQKPVPITANDSMDLPPNLETALQLFVAALYISHMGGEQHSQKGDSYYGAYLRHIGEDEAKDLSSTSEVEENDKFTDRGFV